MKNLKEVEKEITKYFINNNIPLKSKVGKSTVKLVVYGRKESGWSSASTAWLKKWFPDKPSGGKSYIYILSLIGKRFCNKCQKIKTLEDFNKNATKAQGLNDWCVVCHRSYSSNWTANNQEKRKIAEATRRSAKLKRTPKWANLQDIADFYSKCPEGHQVDHIIPLQGNKVSGLHILENLQYLTIKENLSKGNKFLIK